MIKNTVLLLILAYLFAAALTPFFIKYFQIDSLSEPGFKAYRSDEASFVKTLYLMNRGEDYYRAFKEARENLVGGVRINNEVLTYRLPTIFYIWNFFDGLESTNIILTLFIFLSICFIVCSYFILRKISNNWLAIAGSFMTLPYLYDTFNYKSAFLFIEWWGLFFFIFGLTSLFYKKTTAAIFLFSLALCTRELFIIPVLILFLYSLLKKKDVKVFLLPIIIFGVFYIFHYFRMSSALGIPDTGFLSRIHQFSKVNFLHMISFSMRTYAIGGFKSHYLLIFLGIASVIGNLLLHRTQYLWYLALIILSFIVVLPMISIAEDDYWGIMFVPFILICVPLIFNLKKLSFRK